jgi:hypothetical protein
MFRVIRNQAQLQMTVCLGLVVFPHENGKKDITDCSIAFNNKQLGPELVSSECSPLASLHHPKPLASC